MNKNLLLQVLEKFNKKELNLLTSFIKSPYFNKSQLLIDTLYYLINCLKNGRTPKKVDLFQQLFDEKEQYNDHKIRLLLSDLLRLVESFISHQVFQKENSQKELIILKFYRKNGLEKHFHRLQKKIDHHLIKNNYKNHTYFTTKNQLEWEQIELKVSKKRDLDINLQEIGQNFDIAYFSNKLRQACLLKAQQAFYHLDYDFEWVEQILGYIDKKGLGKTPAISIYYNAYLLNTEHENFAVFDKFKQQILEYGTLFPPEEIRDIYLFAINYCIRKVNTGQSAFLQESLSLYKKGLEIGCFMENGHLSKFTFANVVANSLMVKDYDWTELFINDYKNKLPKSSRQSAVAFNMARLKYVKDKDYETALHFLQKISDKDLLNTLNAKILQLRIYWETKEFSLLDSHLEAMSNFIRRREIIGYHKDNFMNIIKYTKRLLKVNFYDKSEINKLKEMIQNESIISEKKWLLKQIENMNDNIGNSTPPPTQ